MKDKTKIMEHLKSHGIEYPATDSAIKAACKDMSDFTKEEKAWFMSKLPAGTYQSPEAVMKEIGMQMPMM